MYYRANGKLLLTGEYFVLNGALSLALPAQKGQSLAITEEPFSQPILKWEAYNRLGRVWIAAILLLPNLNILACKERSRKQVNKLQNILMQAKLLNPNFLSKAQQTITVQTNLEFSEEWGLGTSSTLIYNIAKWANIDPFVLNHISFNGSGYDIACANAKSAIYYQLQNNKPIVKPAPFNPPFAKNLYFVYLRFKKDTRQGITHYQKYEAKPQIIDQLSDITRSVGRCKRLTTFEELMTEHESIVSTELHLKTANSIHFPDYPFGIIKSLGAWGGDFVLASSSESEKVTKAYFASKGFTTVVKYKDMILANDDESESEFAI